MAEAVTRTKLTQQLLKSDLEVTFKKKDGTERVMIVTLSDIPDVPTSPDREVSGDAKPKRERKPLPDTHATVYERGVGWKTLILENIISIREVE